MPLVEPAHRVLLLVGREDVTPPGSFGGATCVSTRDCLAIGVAPRTEVEVAPAPGTASLVRLGEFRIESEGLLSLRSAYSREYDTIGVEPGLVLVTVWADDPDEPSALALQVGPTGPAGGAAQG